MEANTTTHQQFAGFASVARGQAMEKAMSAPTAKTAATRKAPVKAETPDVVNYESGETRDAARTKQEKKAYTATGRSGQPTTRTSATRMTHAVDVQRDGRANYEAGVIVKLFGSEASAMAFADAVNSGEMRKRNDWYETAKNAVVVTCTEAK